MNITALLRRLAFLIGSLTLTLSDGPTSLIYFF